MTATYMHISDLAKEAQQPASGTLSRTLYNYELPEHTASMPAVLHFLQGEAKLMLGDDRHEAAARGPSSLVRLRADLVRQLKGSWSGWLQ
jgi:hypothetical protein